MNGGMPCDSGQTGHTWEALCQWAEMHECGMPCDSGQTGLHTWEALCQWADRHEWGMPCYSGQTGYTHERADRHRWKMSFDSGWTGKTLNTELLEVEFLVLEALLYLCQVT